MLSSKKRSNEGNKYFDDFMCFNRYFSHKEQLQDTIWWLVWLGSG